MNVHERLCDRLKIVREALGLSQQGMADAGGVSLRSQQNYEAGLRQPDAAYLAAIAGAGADVLYILTGVRPDTLSAPALKPDEAALLDNYRNTPEEKRGTIREVGAAFAQRVRGKRSA